MAIAGSLTYDTKIDNKGFEKGLKNLQTSSVVAGNIITDVFKKSVAIVKDFVTETINVGKNFDVSMSRVKATSEATEDEMKELRATAKKMGEETKFSATDAADALNYLALAGYDTKKSIETLPYILNLASAGGFDLAKASDMVTDAMTALGKKAGTTKDFVDKLAKTSQSSNTNIEQLGEAILTVGGTARKLAGGTVELNTMLGILADASYKGAEGGTVLRNIILSLTAPTEQASEEMKKLGVNVFDAQGNMRPLNEIFKDFDKNLSKMTEKDKANALSNIFNRADLKAIEPLLEASGQRFDELSSKIENADGASQRMAETMEDNLQGDMTKLGSKLEGVQIQLYEKLEPALRSGTEALSKALDLVSWFISNGSTVIGILTPIVSALVAYKTTLLAITAINMVKNIMGTVTAFFQLLPAVKSVKDMMLLLNMAFAVNPVALIIAGIVALIAIFAVLWVKCEGFRNFWIGLWKKIQDIFIIGVNFVKNNWKTLILFLTNPLARAF